MKTELLALTLLWAITLNGFAIAVNARGPARVTLSYFFAILSLCASIFHTIQYVVKPNSAEAAVLEAPSAPPLPAEAPVEPATVVQPSVADTTGLAASQMAAALNASRNDMTQVVEQARRLAERLSAVDLGKVPDLSDAEYDAMQNKSFGFRNEVGKLKERLSALLPGAPAPLKATATRLQNAVNQLNQSVQSYDRFFKAENNQEEDERQQAFQSSTQSALATLKQVESELAAP